jgi:hypothetical protein
MLFLSAVLTLGRRRLRETPAPGREIARAPAHGIVGILMLIPAELREQSCFYRRLAERECNLAIKRLLARHALAVAQLAERIERDQAAATAVA